MYKPQEISCWSLHTHKNYDCWGNSNILENQSCNRIYVIYITHKLLSAMHIHIHMHRHVRTYRQTHRNIKYLVPLQWYVFFLMVFIILFSIFVTFSCTSNISHSFISSKFSEIYTMEVKFTSTQLMRINYLY